MGDWILPSKHIKTLDKYFDDGEVRGKELMEKYGKTEVDTEVETLSQSFEVKNTLEKPSDSFKA
jgi:hypothetical protein